MICKKKCTFVRSLFQLLNMKKIEKIFVSQAQPTGKNPFANLIKQYGVQVDFVPLVHIEPLSVSEFRATRINLLDYSSVIFTSTLAIDYYFHFSKELRLTIPITTHYYCMSEAIAYYLQKYIEYRKRKIFFSEQHNFDELITIMQQNHPEKCLLVCSDSPNTQLLEALSKHKIDTTPATMYHSINVKWDKEKPFDYDMVVIFTPAAATALKQNFSRLPSTKYVIAAMGTNTIQALENYKYKVQIKAPTKDCPSIFTAIEKFLEKTQK